MGFANSAGNQLGVLGTKINNENWACRIVIRNYPSLASGRGR